MRYAHVAFRGRTFVGVLEDDRFHPFDLSPEQSDLGVLAVIDALAQRDSLPSLSTSTIAAVDVTILPPIPRPRRNIFCIVKNYTSLVREVAARGLGDEVPTEPICYTKVPDSVVGHLDPVKTHARISDCVDYEAELGVVIGRRGCDIDETDAMNHVFGYTIVNDIAARDIQYRDGQWDLSKSLDTFCRMGPVIVGRDSIDAANTPIKLWVNGELRQDGNTSDFIFTIPTVIATLSRGMTLYPGDIISTGSPAGVGMCMTPPSYLKSGDVIKIDVPGIGELINTMVD